MLKWFAAILTLLSALALPVSASAETAAGASDQVGIAAKRPVLGAACKACPWGVAAEIVRKAMQPYGYDVLVCNTCSLPEAPRLVSGAKMPPPFKSPNSPFFPDALWSPVPNGPVDFGAAASLRVWQAYSGTHDYANEPAHSNLRLVATLQNPNYLAVAATAESGITDLAKIREQHWPVRILMQNLPEQQAILAWYGLTPEAIVAAGGYITNDRTKPFDLIIHNSALGNAPEYNVWLEKSQKLDLHFLQLPEPLLRKLAADNELDLAEMPLWLFRGVDRPIRTVVQTGNSIYLRADAPSWFAYDIAKALDEQQDVLQWSSLNFYYDVHKVWKNRSMPLHPGAEKYYRERGYMK